MASRWKKRSVRMLLPVHRYLGLAMSLLLLLWFASGIVMIYHGYPDYTTSERRAALPKLHLEQVQVSPARAVRALGLDKPPLAVRVNRIGQRSRLHLLTAGGVWRSVYADTGQPVSPLDRAAARRRAQQLTNAPVEAITLFGKPDQWTFSGSLDAFRPLWRVQIADAADTTLYFSKRTGELVHRTIGIQRAWGYAGAVIHWIYPTQLRRLSGVWAQVVIWLSGITTLACLSGLVLGVLVWRRNRKPRDRRGPSPYRGMTRWHHYLGLAFGVLASTWAFSGMLSLDPFSWRTDSVLDDRVKKILNGTPRLRTPSAVPDEMVRPAHFAGPVREVTWQFVNERHFYVLHGRSGNSRWVVASTGTPRKNVLSSEQVRASVTGLPGHTLTSFGLQRHYDHYYYGQWDAPAPPPLPVYKAVYENGARVYINPATGEVELVSTAGSRLLRWLYNGLHSLDFPALNPGSLLWYVLILVLMLGGTALSITSLWLTAAYLRN